MAALAREASRNEYFRQHVGAAIVPNTSIGVLDSWIRQHFRYRDEIEEIVREPAAMLEDLQLLGYVEGDCDDVATFTAAVLRAYGYPAKLVAIRYNAADPEFRHVFVESDGVRLDATVPEGTQHQEIERMVQDVM